MFKFILNYIRYRKCVDDNKDEIVRDFNIKIDNLYRLGTKISIPNNRFTVLKEYKNSELDIYNRLNDEVKKYLYKLDAYLMKKNLMEYIGIYNVERVSDNLVVLVMSFRLFNIVKLANINRIVMGLSTIGLFIGFYDILYMIPFGVVLMLSLLINLIMFRKLFV